VGHTAAGDNDVANGRYFGLDQGLHPHLIYGLGFRVKANSRYFGLDQGLHPHLVYGLGLTRKTWMEHRFSG